MNSRPRPPPPQPPNPFLGFPFQLPLLGKDRDNPPKSSKSSLRKACGRKDLVNLGALDTKVLREVCRRCHARAFRGGKDSEKGAFRRCLESERSPSLRGKWRGATGLRASEREVCLWEGLWEEGLSEVSRSSQRFLEAFRGSQRFSEIFQRFSEVLSWTFSNRGQRQAVFCFALWPPNWRFSLESL